MALTVDQLYELILNRPADPGGKSFWSDYTKGGPTRGVDPEELDAFIAGAQNAGERISSTGTQQVLGLLTGTAPVQQPQPETAAEAVSPPPPPSPRYTNFEVIEAPVADVDQGNYQEGPKYFATDSQTGERVELLKASEYPVGKGPEGTEWLARRAGGQFDSNGKQYLPFEALDANGNLVGTWNMQKNEPSDFQRIGTAIAVAVAASVMGPAVGTALGLSGTAATVVGNAIVSGATTGVITGDAEKAALAALTSAAGSYVSDSGIISDTLADLGLEDVADFLDTNLVTKNVTNSINEGTVSSLFDDVTNTITTIGNKVGATTVADTITAATTGMLTTGVDKGTVEVTGTRGTTTTTGDVATGAATGLTTTGTDKGTVEVTGDRGTTTTTTGDVVTGGLLTGATTLAGRADTGTVTDKGTVEVVGNRGTTPTTGDVVTGAVLPAVVPPPGSGPLVSTNTGSQPAPDAPPTSVLTNLLGLLSGTDLLSNLANAGIDYTTLSELENMTAGKADEVRRAFEGAAKDVQFTPYTVTTGAGSVAFGTGEGRGEPTLTVSASPEYQALRQQALQQAGTTLGAINPADSAQSLYDRARALSAPTEQRQQEQLLSTLGARGLLGIGRNMPTVGGTTTAVNPYVESLLSAQRTADANLALQSQQYGTQEAMRQQQLAQGLLGMGQGIDIAAERTLTPSLQFGSTLASNQQMNANRGLQALETGQKLATAYDLANLDARTQLLKAQAEAAKGVTNTVVPKVFDLFSNWLTG